MSKKIVVLVSGGLDSVIMYRKAVKEQGVENVKAVYVQIGQVVDCVDEELQALHDLHIPFHHITIDLDGFEIDPVVLDMSKYIIPARNLIFTLIGAWGGDEIWLGALSTEMHDQTNRDKGTTFLHDTNKTLDFLYYMVRGQTKLVYPLARYTKSKALRYALVNGLLTEDEVKKTITCYTPEDSGEHKLITKRKHCGNCLVCAKKYIAMVNATLDTTDVFVNDPMKSTKVLNYIEAVQVAGVLGNTKHYDPQRIDEVNEAMSRVNLGMKYE